jgi:hypothetical protein
MKSEDYFIASANLLIVGKMILTAYQGNWLWGIKAVL